MAKLKPSRGKSTAKPSARAAIPCLILIVSGMILMTLLFWGMLKST